MSAVRWQGRRHILGRYTCQAVSFHHGIYVQQQHCCTRGSWSGSLYTEATVVSNAVAEAVAKAVVIKAVADAVDDAVADAMTDALNDVVADAVNVAVADVARTVAYAVSNSRPASAVMQVTNSTFAANLAERDAAVYSMSVTATFNNCRFDKNSASLHGSSAVGASGGVVRVMDTTFSQNTSPASKVQQVSQTYSASAQILRCLVYPTVITQRVY